MAGYQPSLPQSYTTSFIFIYNTHMYIPHYEKKKNYRKSLQTCNSDKFIQVCTYLLHFYPFLMCTRIDTYIYIWMTPPPFLTLKNKINRWFYIYIIQSMHFFQFWQLYWCIWLDTCIYLKHMVYTIKDNIKENKQI